jgi:hypothetical protein
MTHTNCRRARLVVDRADRGVRNRDVGFDEHVHEVEVQQGVAVRPGHLAVGLGDHHSPVTASGPDRGRQHVDLDAQRHRAVAGRRRVEDDRVRP